MLNVKIRNANNVRGTVTERWGEASKLPNKKCDKIIFT